MVRKVAIFSPSPLSWLSSLRLWDRGSPGVPRSEGVKPNCWENLKHHLFTLWQTSAPICRVDCGAQFVPLCEYQPRWSKWINSVGNLQLLHQPRDHPHDPLSQTPPVVKHPPKVQTGNRQQKSHCNPLQWCLFPLGRWSMLKWRNRKSTERGTASRERKTFYYKEIAFLHPIMWVRWQQKRWFAFREYPTTPVSSPHMTQNNEQRLEWLLCWVSEPTLSLHWSTGQEQWRRIQSNFE